MSQSNAKKSPGNVSQLKRQKSMELLDAIRHSDRKSAYALFYASSQIPLEAASFHKKCSFGRSFLHVAASLGHLDVCEALLTLGAKVDILNIARQTPLMIAAKSGHLELLSCLLSSGAKVNATDDWRNTALNHAAAQGHVDVCAKLLDAGADASLSSRLGFCPILSASSNGHADCVSALLERGLNIESRDSTGNTALHLAAMNGHVAVADLLIRSGHALTSLNSQSKTALHLAAEHGHALVFSRLVEAGLNVLAMDKDGLLPIHLAASCKPCVAKTDIVRQCIHADTPVDVADPTGRTALHMACKAGDRDVSFLLLEAGADATLKARGSTPAGTAGRNGYPELAGEMRAFESAKMARQAMNRVLAEAMPGMTR